ncbi:MAG: aldolase [Methanothrix sp.]|uniref:aldolase n=1 Tax=Methanothrix sp. TaxID=90426 RepID=UPI0025F99A31|nr:aldolase [Methanothrix sp.]MBK7386006.1 aldolase [Methanothrix sp.]
MIENENIKIPLDVPAKSRNRYRDNYLRITKGRERLMLFAGDQKAEHLNDDFFGEGIDREDNDPEHLFRIAASSNIGVFATQLGLIARYGMDYPSVPYLVKLNSKTNLIKAEQADPRSPLWIDVPQVVEFMESSKLDILGVGYTIYLGSEHEGEMLSQAARLVYQAHQAGLVTVLWVYPRGRAVADERDPHLIAGAAGVALTLGSDFVKLNYPAGAEEDRADLFKEAVQAAGRTKVVCAGGESTDARLFLQRLHDQIHISGAAGNATGRNIHQRPLDEAIRLCNAIYAITLDNASVDWAYRLYSGE